MPFSWRKRWGCIREENVLGPHVHGWVRSLITTGLLVLHRAVPLWLGKTPSFSFVAV